MTDPIEALLSAIADRVVERVRTASHEHVYEDELVLAIGSRAKARRLLKSGDVSGSFIGRRMVADRASLTAYIARHRSQPVTNARPVAEPSVEVALGKAGLRVVGGR